MVERGILDAVDAQDGVERAALAFMRKLDAFDIVGRPAGLSGDVENILGRDVDELGLRIDEAPDQPRAGDAVDLRALARHPLAGRCADCSARRQALGYPAR